MTTISKYVYTHHIRDWGGKDFDNILTVGKIYEITKETSICPVTNLDLSRISFIAYNGHFYLIEL